MSIKSWLRNWLMAEDRSANLGKVALSAGTVTADDTNFENYRETIRFTVQPARGGIIVTVKQYDAKRDENNHTVHVIQDNEDVAQSIAHIVSMELLRS